MNAQQLRPKEDLADTALFIAIVVVLVLVAGLMSGLTLGLLSLSRTDLEVLRRSGTLTEQKWAARIDPVLKRPHFLLVTLVLCNAAATEALPIFLDRLLDPITAVIISIVVVLIFGEIIPQAVCARYGLAVGAYSAWFVRALMLLCSIVAWPLSKILDCVLGFQHDALFRRSQLKALVSLHSQEEGFGGTLSTDEISIIRGALDLSSKTASACMTPLDKVFMLSSDTVLSEACLLKILDSGHSRVPVHRPGRRAEIIGLLLVKELIIVDKTAGTRAGEVRMRGLPYLQANTSLYEILHLFESGRCHMAVLIEPSAEKSDSVMADEQLEEVIQIRIENEHIETRPLLQRYSPSEVALDTEAAPSVLGIVTIEDIFEELIQAEDNEGLQRVNAGALLSQLPPHLRSLVRSRQFLPRVGPYRVQDDARSQKLDRALASARVEAAKRTAEAMQAGRQFRSRSENTDGTAGSTGSDRPSEVQKTAGELATREATDDLSRPLLDKREDANTVDTPG